MANARRRTQRTNRTNTRTAARSAGTAPEAATVETEEMRTSKMLDWQNEMTYIKKDLRELLTISVALFGLLFVVGFFL